MVQSTLIGYLAVCAALLGAYVLVIFYLAPKASRGEPLGPVRPETPNPIPRNAAPAEQAHV